MRWWALVGAACVWCAFITRAEADDGAATAAAASDDDAEAPILLQLSGSAVDEVDAERVRAELQAELGRPVLLSPDGESPAMTLSLAVEPDSIVASRVDADGTSLTRTLSRPEGQADLLTTLRWIGGNLARDEAAEILAELRPPSESSETEASMSDAATADPVAASGSNAVDAPAPTEETAPSASFPRSPVQVSFVHPLSLYPDGHRRRFHLAFSPLVGNSGGIEGFALDGLVGLRAGAEDGVTMAGLYSHVGGRVRGLKLSGLVSTEAPSVSHGVSLAGLATVQAGKGSTESSFTGLRLAGLATVHFQASHGITLAGLATLDEGGSGARLSGGLNLTKDLDGVMVTSGVNAARDVRGAQIGIINVARDVEGAQVGLVNVSRKMEGAAIGAVNLSEGSRISAVAFASNHALFNAGASFVVEPIATTLTVGYDPLSDSDRFVAPELVIAYRASVGPVWFDLGGGWSQTFDTDALGQQPEHAGVIRPSVGIQAADWIGFFGGAGARIAADDAAASGVRVEPDLAAGLALF